MNLELEVCNVSDDTVRITNSTKIHIGFDMKAPEKIFGRILDDSTGRFVAETWGKIFTKYTPKDTGTLSQHYTTEPWKVTYEEIYAHYQWNGLSKNKKPLNYNKEKNFLAQSHWEEQAEKDKKKEVAKAITAYLRRK